MVLARPRQQKVKNPIPVKPPCDKGTRRCGARVDYPSSSGFPSALDVTAQPARMKPTVVSVCVLGANGFVGRHLVRVLSAAPNECTVLPVAGRQELNLLDAEAVARFFVQVRSTLSGACAHLVGWANICGRTQHAHFDIVFLTSAIGGTRLQPETEQTELDNVRMVENVMAQEAHFGTVVLFGSGAEYDRTKPVTCAVPALGPPPPPQWYGRAKWQLRQRYVGHSKVVMWRILGCYGPDELPQRFVRSCRRHRAEGTTVNIDADRLFDIVHIDHVCDWALRLVRGDADARRPIDLVYAKKMLLSQIAAACCAQYTVAHTSDVSYIGVADTAFAALYQMPPLDGDI